MDSSLDIPSQPMGEGGQIMVEEPVERKENVKRPSGAWGN